MPDRAHIRTDAALHRAESQLRALYKQLDKDVQAYLDPLWDDLLLEDEGATQKRRLDHAKKNGLDTAIAAVVALILATNEQAIEIINGELDGIYGLNYGYMQQLFRVEYDVVIPDKEKLLEQLQNRYDRRAYNRLQDHKYVSKEIVDTVYAGIKRGEDIPSLTKRVQNASHKSRNSSINTARTETTRIQSRSRIDSGHEIEKMGAVVEKAWVFTHDGVTRDTHEIPEDLWIPLDDIFPNGLEFPGDPNGEAKEVCNCRCYLILRIVRWDK